MKLVAIGSCDCLRGAPLNSTCGGRPSSPARERPRMATHYPLDRRTFLVAGGLSFFGLELAHGAAHAAGQVAPARRKRAKSTILIWLSGGASHIDTWDMKPDA